MLNQRLADATIDNYLETTDATSSLTEEQMRRYHDQAISQAHILFWFSLVVATAGFILISYVVIRSSQVNDMQLLLKSLPGTAIEIVAVLFFRQAREARQRATALYDRMRLDKWQKDAITLVYSIDDSKLRSVAKAQLAFQIIELLSTCTLLENRSAGSNALTIFNRNKLSYRRHELPIDDPPFGEFNPRVE